MHTGASRKVFTIVVFLTAFMLPLAAPGQLVATAGDQATQSIPDKRIVDCLLQGQIHKLGNTVYQMPPRPVKLPAIDCEIRGGDFLLYDRASFASSLAHWLGLAKDGDVKAQVYVGEIFERGLGREPDYSRAADWYRQAAEAGSPEAQISLAQLYEKGLGVPRDPDKAERLYQMAFGPDLAPTVALDPGSIDEPAERIRVLEQRLQEAEREATALRDELRAARVSLAHAEQDLRQQEAEEERLKLELEAAQARHDAASGNAAEDETSAELEATKNALADQQRIVGRLKDEIDRNREQIRAYETDFDQVTELQAQLSEQSAQFEEKNRELGETRAALAESNRRLAQQQRAYEDARAELEKLRRASQESDAGDNALATELRDHERRLEEQAAMLAAMRSENDQREAQKTSLQEELEELRARNEELAASREEAARQQREAERLRALLAETQAQLGVIEAEKVDSSRLQELQSELDRVREEADRYKERIDRLETAKATAVALAGPSIQLIEPAGFHTRGIQDVTLRRSDAEHYEIVGKVTAPAGVLSVHVNEQTAPFNANNVFRHEVPLSGEKTPVRVTAIDNQGERAEQIFNLLRDAATIKSPAAALPRVSFGEFHALLIGNEDYAMLPDLMTPKEDVRVLADILSRRYGFKTTVIEDGTRSKIMDGMYSLLGELTSEDNLLIYYAGHGDYVTDTKRGVWLPVDANPSSPANWITNIEINDYLKQIRAKQIVVIADSCYSGALTRSALINLRPGLTDEEYEAHLEKMAKIRSRVVLTSGALAPVLDSSSPGAPHSIFAAALIEILNENTAVLSAQDLGRTIAAKVSLAATKVGYDQEPQYAPLNHASHQGGDFFFVPKVL